MGREFELKFSATPQQLTEIEKNWENWVDFSMETTYFDTLDSILSNQNCTLRHRRENGCSVCTLKTPISSFGRGEWDAWAPWNAQTVSALFDAAKLPAITFSSLTAVCGARFHRRAATVELTDSTVEIALDEGVLLGGGKEIPLCEVEVELKSGEEASAVAFAQALAEHYGLQPETRSKFRRALALRRGE
ncbi:MAG: CYTH domain-containing protein [Ruminococcaceae bacterium]|nr:CYTH domain-containing protein [Oscillospiraceae bacterium]